MSDLLLILTPWLFYTLPVLLGSLVIAVVLRRRIRYSPLKVYGAAIVLGVLVAPMPIGIFVSMLPNGILFFSDPGSYVQYLFKVWSWFVISAPISVVMLAFCFELILSKHQAEHHRRYQSLKRLLIGGAGVFLIAALLTSVRPEDRTCHNVLREGRTSISPKVTIDLDLPIENWPDIEEFYREFSGRYALSIREGRTENTESVKLLSLSMCRESGVTISTNEQRWKHRNFKHPIPGRGIGVRVYQIEENADWVGLARTLIAEVRQTWPDQARVTVKEGDPVQLLPELVGD